ncbi:hypothetical protein CG701_26135, partial [Escherichia coli]
MDHVLTGDPFEIRVTDFGEGIFFWRCQGKVTGGRDVAIPVLMTPTITIEGGTVAKLAMRQPFVLFKGL